MTVMSESYLREWIADTEQELSTAPTQHKAQVVLRLQVLNERLSEGNFMTQDQINKLAALAVAVSSAAPLRFPATQPGYLCYIPRDLVKQIRAALDEGKYDWRAQHHSRRGK